MIETAQIVLGHKLDILDDLQKEIVGKCALGCEDGFIYSEKQSKEIDFYPERKLCKCRKKYDKYWKFALSNIPKAFWDLNGKYQVKCKEYLFDKEKLGNIKKFMPTVNKFIENHETVISEGYSLLFSGMNGSGKTFVAIKILKEFALKEYSVYYIHFRELLELYYDGLINKNKSAIKLLQHIKNVDLLCIDEIGKENKTTDTLIGEFEYWLKFRNENNKATIVITNKRIPVNDEEDNFHQTYGDSIWDIFKQSWRLFAFDPSNDFRLKTRKTWSF